METVEQIFEKIMEERNWDKQQLAEYIADVADLYAR